MESNKTELLKRIRRRLLIKDLCARLPYGVKSVYMKYGRYGDKFKEIDNIIGVNGETFIASRGEEINLLDDTEANEFKPILFPLKSINEELDIEGRKIIVKNIIQDKFEHSFYIENDGDIDIEGSEASYVYLHEYEFIIDTFHRYHIDYQDLIGQGLAISVFDLPENPYK